MQYTCINVFRSQYTTLAQPIRIFVILSMLESVPFDLYFDSVNCQKVTGRNTDVVSNCFDNTFPNWLFFIVGCLDGQ